MREKQSSAPKHEEVNNMTEKKKRKGSKKREM
jgi:hypothetical protein